MSAVFTTERARTHLVALLFQEIASIHIDILQQQNPQLSMPLGFSLSILILLRQGVGVWQERRQLTSKRLENVSTRFSALGSRESSREERGVLRRSRVCAERR
jgi:hypothetical protein